MSQFDLYPTVAVTLKSTFRMMGLKFLIKGAEHVPNSGGVVLACNHVGYIDWLYAGYAIYPERRIRVLAKEVLFRTRGLGWIMKGCHHIPVDREAGAEAYKLAVEKVLDGETVLIFPEGTVSRSFRLKEFKSGAVRMAQETGAPLLPVIVWGAHRIVTKERKSDFTSRGRTISVTIGQPVPLDPQDDPVEATARLKAEMETLYDETVRAHPDGPDGPDDTWWIPVAYGGTAPTPEEAREAEAADKLKRQRHHKERLQIDAEKAAKKSGRRRR